LRRDTAPSSEGKRSAVTEHTLTEREAFDAMSRFLWQYANRAGDRLFDLLGDIHLENDGLPTDPAAWDDWMACVREVKAR
jgi:hypothetical protein